MLEGTRGKNELDPRWGSSMCQYIMSQLGLDGVRRGLITVDVKATPGAGEGGDFHICAQPGLTYRNIPSPMQSCGPPHIGE